ncbi:hypothetical protein RU86_GL001808 [Lactococcus piscium]|uniref:Uncharacterized protein n=1 Tax=Pseudolactococcus piscium TaxID=1364 RepID=A0A2A5RTQ1_9LACT|nr:hypothetical protein [Lactococcus piscium]PCS03653.1 hypothetical protein RU86_GL001808 [Lactococcus piscium]
MAKRLFGASFKESTKITHNLFDKKQVWYDSGARGSQKLGARIFNLVPLLCFNVLIYGLGVFSPETADMGTSYIKDIWQGAQYFQWLKMLIIMCIIIWSLLILINIFPKSNYMITRVFEISNLVLMMMLSFLSFMPMLLGMTLGATGWLGFSVICLYGFVFFLNTLQSSVKNIKQELYGELTEEKTSLVAKIWQRLKQFWLAFSVLLVLNILIFRIGMWGSFSIWRFVCLFAGPIYFGILTLFICGPMKLYISTFYFAKYSEQYRVLWRVTDEKWYGKRKAKKLAKKQLKQEKRGK